MSEDVHMATPPPRKRSSLDEKELLKTPSPMLDRPSTPSRKSKQEFVYELWTLISQKLEPMMAYVDTVLLERVVEQPKILADLRTTEEIKSEEASGDISMQGSVEEKNEEEESKKPDFMEVTGFIKDKTVMECTSRFWAVLTSFVRQRRLHKGKMRAEMKEARIILTSLVIVLFPQDTLDISDLNDIEPLSEAVYNGAKDVVELVFRLAPPTVMAANKLRCDEAAKTIEDFLQSFSSWQRKDKTKMLESLKNYFEEWARSKKVLQSTSMNELQRNAVLDTVNKSIENTRLRMSKLIGKETTDEICAEIEDRIDSEPAAIHSPKHATKSVSAEKGAPTPFTTPADSFVMDDKSAKMMRSSVSAMKDEASESTAEKLRKYGIPAKLRSGLATPSGSHVSQSASMAELTGTSTEEHKQTGEMTSDGRMVINLDELIAQEGAKKYWSDFAKEIEEGKFHRLFELLAELLIRLKKVSPDGDTAYLDEIIDVDMLSRSIEHGMIDARGFYGIFDAIWTQMNRIHAPIFDKEWKEWHDSVVEDMSRSYATWAQLLPNVMNRLLIKLDEIEDAIKALAPHLKKSSKYQKIGESEGK